VKSRPSRTAGPKTAAFPGRVVAYTGILAGGVGALALVGAAIDRSVGVPWTALVPFVALLTIAECLLVRVHVRGQVMAITLFEAALAPLLFTAPTLAVIGVVAIAETITGRVRKNQPVKHAFNVVQFSAAAAVGSVVFNALRHGPAATPWNLFALAFAMTSVAVVNVLTLSTVIHLAERIPFVAVLRKLGPTMVFGWTVNTVFGVLFAATYVLTAWTIALFSIPMLLLYSAFKGHATALADRARLAGMHRATRELADPVDPRDAIPQFLVAVRECFDAAEAELVLREGEVRVVHSVGRDGVASYSSTNERWGNDPFAVALLATRQGAIVRADDRSPTAAWLRREGRRECIAAPLFEGDHPLGVMRVYDCGGPEGFEQGGLAVLEALASEATRALIKSELLDKILASSSSGAVQLFVDLRGIGCIAGRATSSDPSSVEFSPNFHRAESYAGLSPAGAAGADSRNGRTENCDRQGGSGSRSPTGERSSDAGSGSDRSGETVEVRAIHLRRSAG